MDELQDGFEYGSEMIYEEDDSWYVPKEDWSNLPKEFLPPPGTCNINFCTDINLRALDAMTQKDNKIAEQASTIEMLEAQVKVYAEQVEILKSKNVMLIDRVKSLSKQQ